MALVVLVAGCGTTGPGKGVGTMAQNCRNMASCTITVDPSGGNMPDRVVVTKGQATVIHWDLKGSPPWKWGDKGVEFKPPGDRHFNCSSGGGASTRRTCTKPESAPAGEFEYKLHLVYDPFMVNE